MMKRRTVTLLLVLLIPLLSLFFLGQMVDVAALRSTSSDDTSWAMVFSETFTTTLGTWSITETTETGYQWAEVPYTYTTETESTLDRGLWVAGGGTEGETQVWPSGTYTNRMTTLAIAGPFTPTDTVLEMRIQARILNDIAASDVFSIGLSDDGLIPDAWASNIPKSSEWQSLSWATQAFTRSQHVWIFLRFESDDEGVATGTVVDDLSLDFRYPFRVYFPFILRDPTPTPTPTPTPIPRYVDHFSDPNSGWYTGEAERLNYYLVGDFWRVDVVAEMSYRNGNYRIWVPRDIRGGGNVDSWFVWPAEMAPLPASFKPIPNSYCVETRAKFANSTGEYDPWWAHWGLVFGANSDRSEIYTFQVNANHDYAVLRYHNYIYPGNRGSSEGNTNVEIAIIDWAGRDLGRLIPTTQYNTLKVAVDGGRADFYANGVHLAAANVSGMPKNQIGVIGGSYEVTPVEVTFDYFRYDPYCDGN